VTFLLALLKSKTFWMIAGAVALALALIAFVAYRDHGIRVEERAKWQVKLQQCNDAVEVALRANETLQQSASRLTEQIGEQNRRIQDLLKMEQLAQKQKNEALAKVLQKGRQLREEVSRLTIIAAGPPAPTKEEGCEDAYRYLRDYAVSVRGAP
jgi:ABC-type lipopolysaccharide export system ATPase subunit